MNVRPRRQLLAGCFVLTVVLVVWVNAREHKSVEIILAQPSATHARAMHSSASTKDPAEHVAGASSELFGLEPESTSGSDIFKVVTFLPPPAPPPKPAKALPPPPPPAPMAPPFPYACFGRVRALASTVNVHLAIGPITNFLFEVKALALLPAPLELALVGVTLAMPSLILLRQGDSVARAAAVVANVAIQLVVIDPPRKNESVPIESGLQQMNILYWLEIRP